MRNRRRSTRACTPGSVATVEGLEQRRLLAATIAFADPMTTTLPGAATDLVAGRFGGTGSLVLADGVAVREGSSVQVLGLAKASDADLSTRGTLTFPAGQTPDTIVAGDLDGDTYADLTLVGTGDGRVRFEGELAAGDGQTFTASTTVESLGLVYTDGSDTGYAGNRAAYVPAGPAAGDTASIAVFGSTVVAHPGDYVEPAFNFAGLDTVDTAPSAAGQVDGGIIVLDTTGPNVAAPAETDVVSGDFNGDGNADVAGVDASTGGIAYQITDRDSYGDYTVDPATIQHLSSTVTALAVADVNGDGRADLIGWGSPSSPDDIFIWYGQADGTLTAGPTIKLGGTATAVATADFNGDGHVDLATNLSVLAGNGDGTFAPIVALPSGTSIGTQLIAADVNGDGRPDLIGLSPGGRVATLLMNTATYTPVAPTVTQVGASGPVPVGSAVTLTATVTSSAAASVGPGGAVTFYDGSTALGTSAVGSDGAATFTTTTLAAGPHTIKADYGGGGGYAASTSLAAATAHVQAATALGYYGPIPQYLGEGNTYEGHFQYGYGPAVEIPLVAPTASAITADGLPAPTGTVTLYFDGTEVGTQTLGLSDPPGGYYGAEFDYLDAYAGSHAVTATYSGDDNYAPATLTGINVAIPGDINVSGGEGPVGFPTPTLLVSPTAMLGLRATVTADTLTGSLAAGSRPTGTLGLTLTNLTPDADHGVNTVLVYAVPQGPGGLASGTLLATVRRSLSLAAHASAEVNAAVRLPPGLAVGSYTLFTVATDSAGHVVTDEDGPTLGVAVPAIDLIGYTGTFSPTTLVAGRAGTVTVILTNSGNITAVGPLTVGLDLTNNSGAAGVVPLATVRVARSVPAGKSVTIRMRFRVPAGTTVGPYVTIVTLALRGTVVSRDGGDTPVQVT
jgi:hypothetical protein